MSRAPEYSHMSAADAMQRSAQTSEPEHVLGTPDVHADLQKNCAGQKAWEPSPLFDHKTTKYWGITWCVYVHDVAPFEDPGR